MDAADKISADIPERDVQLSRILHARIDMLPSCSPADRQSIYSKARASIEKRLDKHTVPEWHADADRRSIENAIAITEAFYDPCSRTDTPETSKENPEAAGDDISHPHHAWRSTAVLTAGAIVSLVITTSGLPPATYRQDDALGGNDRSPPDEASIAKGGGRPGLISQTDASVSGLLKTRRLAIEGRMADVALPKTTRLPAARADSWARVREAETRADGNPIPATPLSDPSRRSSDQAASSVVFPDRHADEFQTLSQPSSEPGPTDRASDRENFGVSALSNERTWIEDPASDSAAVSASEPQLPFSDALSPPWDTPATADRNAGQFSAGDEPPPNAKDETVGSIPSADVSNGDGRQVETAAISRIWDGEPSSHAEGDGSQSQAAIGQDRQSTSTRWPGSSRPDRTWAPPMPPANAGIASLSVSPAPDETTYGRQIQPLPPFADTVVFTASPKHDRSVEWERPSRSKDGKASPEDFIRASVWLNERQIATLLLHRNVDAAVPASHVIELIFQPAFSLKGAAVVSIGPASLRDRPDEKGEELVAFPFEIAPGHFVMTLSPNLDSLRQNIRLLTEKSWIGIPLNLSNGTVSLLVLQKGLGGSRLLRSMMASDQVELLNRQ